MSDVTYFNYPFNQYTFSPASLKKVLLMQQGCDDFTRRPPGGYPLGYYGQPAPYSGGCCGGGFPPPFPGYGANAGLFVYQ